MVSLILLAPDSDALISLSSVFYDFAYVFKNRIHKLNIMVRRSALLGLSRLDTLEVRGRIRESPPPKCLQWALNPNLKVGMQNPFHQTKLSLVPKHLIQYPQREKKKKIVAQKGEICKSLISKHVLQYVFGQDFRRASKTQKLKLDQTPYFRNVNFTS